MRHGAALPSRDSRTLRLSWRWVVVAAFLHATPFLARPALIGGDEPHYALASHSIAVDADLALDNQYAAVEAGSSLAGRKRAGERLDQHVLVRGGRKVFAHPIGLPLLAAPVLWILDSFAPHMAPDIPLILLSLGVTFLALILCWQVLRDAFHSPYKAAWIVFAAYFGSPLWYYSRTFFTEPFLWAFTAISVCLSVRRRFLLAGISLALALAMKETGLILALPLIGSVAALLGLRAALILSSGPFLWALWFLLKNQTMSGQPLATFQSYQFGDLGDGALGLLLDSRVGLLWFCPVLALGSLGWVFFKRASGRKTRILLAASFASFAGYFVLTAFWIDWRGGSSYAGRLLLPALPLLAVPLFHLCRLSNTRAMWSLMTLLTSFGFAVNASAALDPVAALWSPTIGEVIGNRPIGFGLAAATSLITCWRLRSRGFRPPAKGDFFPERIGHG